MNVHDDLSKITFIHTTNYMTAIYPVGYIMLAHTTNYNGRSWHQLYCGY